MIKTIRTNNVTCTKCEALRYVKYRERRFNCTILHGAHSSKPCPDSCAFHFSLRPIALLMAFEGAMRVVLQPTIVMELVLDVGWQGKVLGCSAQRVRLGRSLLMSIT